jgi:CheY-like chemotaxis protein
MMGGDIWCESEQGKGSVFNFTVNMALGKEIQPTTDSTDNEEVAFSNLKALVIDDNLTALEIIKETMNGAGLETEAFDSGLLALTHLKKRPGYYDLLLVDWKMPGLDGLETIRRINEDSVLKKTSIIVMVTAYDRDDVLAAAKELGVSKVLTKPINSSHINDILMELFGGGHKKDRKSRRSNDRELVKTIAGARILLVEDNDVNQLVASKILSNAGFVVSIAGDGQKALEMVGKENFDLVLMDVQMPIMDGLTATRRIRESGYNDLPIVAMTAHAMSNDRQLSLDAGMNDHVSKPINVAELLKTLVKWIPSKVSEGNQPWLAENI